MNENEMLLNEEVEVEDDKYSLTLANDNRILCATFEQFNPNGIIVNELPNGDITDYLYENCEYVYYPKPKKDSTDNVPTQLDVIEAQVLYTALMTNTLLGE